MSRVAVEVEDAAWATAAPGVAADVEEAALTALDMRADGEIVLLLSDDATVADLNARYRNREGPTNVLSFPAAASAAPHLGDIVLALGVCAREAALQGKSLRDHARHLTIHGVLHLLGYDHDGETEAVAMEALERALLARLGVADPYAQEAG